MRPGPHAEDGFSLVELMVVMALTAILATAAVAALTTSMRTERLAVDRRVAMDDARTAVSRMLREVRGARRVYPTSTATSLDVWVDQDQDNVQDTVEQVTYEISGTQLVRSDAAGGSRPVVSNLNASSPGFTYDPAPPGTRVVTIRLDTLRDGASSGGLSVSTVVRLRNVR